MLYDNLVTSDFAAKVQTIADGLSIDPSWLMAVMYNESKLNPAAVNSSSGATGLIQFMPSTAQGLGTTTAALAQMDGVSQLDYVQAYYQPYKSKLTDFADVYLAVFFPAGMTQSSDYVLQTDTLAASTIAKQNPEFAQGKDYITVGDVTNVMLSKLPSDIDPNVFTVSADTVTKYATRNWIPITLTGVAMIAIIWYMVKHKKGFEKKLSTVHA